MAMSGLDEGMASLPAACLCLLLSPRPAGEPDVCIGDNCWFDGSPYPSPPDPPTPCVPCQTPETASAPPGPPGCQEGPPGPLPIAHGVDPNDIHADSAVHPGDTVTYTVDFENEDTAPGWTHRVDVNANLDPASFDLSTFQLLKLGVGNTDFNAGEAKPVNGTTVSTNATFNRSTGDLSVTLKGAPNQYTVYDPFLPPNTIAQDPAGTGYVRFSVRARKDLAIGTPIHQAADVIFDGVDNPTIPTDTTIIPYQHPMKGLLVTLGDRPGVPKSRKLMFKTVDPVLKSFGNPTLNGITVYVHSQDGQTDKYFLPAAAWSLHLSKYMYKDPKLKFGPIKGVTVDIAHSTVTLTGKGAQLTRSLATMPTSVDVVLLDEQDAFCTTFNSHIRTTPLKKFSATFAAPPDSCPAIQY
jgi:hypothetical protein